MATNEISSTSESISARSVRLNQLFVGKSSTMLQNQQQFLTKEALLDALFVLYEETQQESMKRDKNVAVFVEKFRTVMTTLKKMRVNVGDFEFKKVIGRGHFGDVQVVREKQTGNVYAMKVLRKTDTLSQQNVAFYDEERDIMAKANSPWITQLQYAFQDTTNLYFVMEFHPGGDLLSLLDRYDNILSEDMARFYLAEISLGIHALHGMGYVHRDIKPDNILIDRTGHVKLADFGSAAKLSKYDTVSSKMPVGTPDYIAPEVLASIEGKKGSYGRSCDWWSLGIVAYEMVCGKTPFSDDKVLVTYSNIMNHNKTLKYDSGIEVSDAMKELIGGLLSEAIRRFDYEQICRHCFFETINWEGIRDSVPPFVPTVIGHDDTSNFEEFDVIAPKVEIPSVSKTGGFSGKNLPFIGFTHTKYAEITTDCMHRSPSQKSVLNLESQLQAKKEEIKELRKRIECYEKQDCRSRAELAKVTLQVQEQEKTKLLAERECERLCKDLMTAKGDAASLKRLIELERTERLKTEKDALHLLEDIREKWKNAEKLKLDQIKQENESLKEFLRELESKYRESKLMTLTLKNELSSALKMSENASVKVQHYKDKLRRSSTGDALQIEVVRQQLAFAQGQLEEVKEEKASLESQISVISLKANEQEQKLRTLEEDLIEARNRNALTEERLRLELIDTKDALDIANDKLTDMTNDLVLCHEQMELLKGRLDEATSSHQECVQQHLQELMRMHDVGENTRDRPTTRQSFRQSKLVAKLQEQETELQRLKDENSCLQDNLMTARDSDSDKTQTVEELRAVVGRLEAGLKKLEQGKVESDQNDEGKVCFEAQVAKLEAQLEKCREANAKEKEATRQLNTELFKRERELRDAKIDNRIANRELKGVSDQLAVYQEKQSKYDEERNKLEAELSCLKSELSSLKRELELKSKTTEKKESDWEREKIRLTEKVNSLQSSFNELREMQTKLGEAEGRAKQADKHLKNLEEQLRGAEEDKRRAHSQGDQIHSDYKKLKAERDVLQKNLDNMKQLCTTMDEQLKDYESLVEASELEEARLKGELVVLQKTIVGLREQVKAANEAALSEKSKMEASKLEAADLVRRSEMADVVRDSELQGVLEQKNEYRSMVAGLTEQVVQLENELMADKSDVLASRLKADKLNEEVVRIKEEAAQLITQIHSLKDTNFKLSRGLEEAIEKCTAAKERNVDLENMLQEVRIGHNVERVKMEETISQQSKLINFLQIKTEAMQKKKKTLTEKLFGRVSAPSLDHQQLQLSPTFNRNLNKTPYTIGRHKDTILEFSKQGNDQSKDMLNILAKSPGLQESPDRPPAERGIPKPSSERMQHRIPHRFHTGLNMHPTKCAACLDSIHFGRNISRCQECRICAHPKCATSLPNACNLPYDLMQHFRHSMRYRKGKEPKTSNNGNKDSNANNQHGFLEGWLKMPRTGIQGWGRHFLRLEGTVLYLYDTDNISSNTAPTDKIQLCPLDSTCKVTEAVLATEMVGTVKSDLPYIFKVTTQPLTTCFPGRCIYFMADNFQDKLQWVAALERTLKSNSASNAVEEESFGSMLFSIDDGSNVDLNCVAYLDEDTVLCGSDDGLYIVDLLEEQGLKPKQHITTFGGVYQMSVEDSIGILILICGNERQLNWMRLSDVRSLVEGSVPYAASQLTMLHLVDSVNSCHLFVASVNEDNTFLCAATANRVILLKWNAVMKAFCIRKELACSESCSCVLFTANSVIVGTDKFYEIDLNNFFVEDFLDDSDPTLAHAVHGAPQIHSFPMAIFQVSPNGIEEEYLLCFYEFGIFVNSFGQRSRRKDMKWSRLPLKFVFRWPYLYVVHFNSIEVCEIIVHKEKCYSVQTFVNVSSPRYLGPSTDSGTIVVAVVKDGQANIFSFNGEASIKRKASKNEGNEITEEAAESESSNSDGDLQFSFSSSVMEALQQDDDPRESEV